MNLDDELRGALLARAEDAPDGAGMLDAIRSTVHRRTVHTRISVAAAATVASVAVAIGTPFVLGPFRSASEQAAAPGPGQNPTPSRYRRSGPLSRSRSVQGGHRPVSGSRLRVATRRRYG
jgi:hypothetical protein